MTGDDLQCPECGSTYRSGEEFSGMEVQAGDRCYYCPGTIKKIPV